MSKERVGLEGLPNVYIKNIEITNSSLDRNFFKVDICAYDYRELDIFKILKGQWSDAGSGKDDLQFLFIASSNSSLNELIKTGQIHFSPQNIKKFVDNQSVFLFKKRVMFSELFEVLNEKYFLTSFEFEFPTNTIDVEVFCCIYLDPIDLSEQDQIRIDARSQIIKGPVSSEKIISYRNVHDKTTIFTNNQGDQHIGPVHYHEEKGYMAGSKHTSAPHSALIEKIAYNHKIKDFRPFGHRQKLHMTSKHKSSMSSAPVPLTSGDDAVFSHLFGSNNSKGNLFGTFGINIEKIIKLKTKYGFLLNNMNPSMTENLFSYFEIKELSIERDRVDRSPFLRFPIISSNDKLMSKNKKNEKYSSMKQTEQTIVSGKQRESQRLENADAPYTVSSEYQLLSSMQEVKMHASPNMRFFNFSDLSMTVKKSGTYKYVAKLSFSDPTVIYVREMIAKLLTNNNQLKNLLNIFNRDRYYNSTLKKINIGEIDNILDLTQQSNMVIKNYIDGYCLLHDLNADERKAFSYKTSSLINVNFATKKSIRFFVKEHDSLISKLFKVFDFKPKEFIKNNDFVYPNKQYRPNFITIENVFSKQIKPNNYKRVYNYFINSSEDANMAITPSNYKQRATDEIKKFYNKTNNKKQIKDASMRFLSPLSVQSNEYAINLDNVDTVDLVRVNEFFKEYINERANKRSGISVKRKDTVESNEDQLIPIQDEQNVSNFIESENYLGHDSLFVNYSFLSVSEDPKTVDSSHDYFEELSRAKIDLMERYNIASKKDYDPSNAKSIYMKAKNSLSEEELKRFLNRLPVAIRSIMLNEKDSKIKINNIDTDPFQNIGTQIAMNITHFKIANIQMLHGFENGDMKKPIFRNIRDTDINNANFKLCRITPHRSKSLKLSEDKLSLPIANEYFFLSSTGDMNNTSTVNLIGLSSASSLVESNYSSDPSSPETVASKKVYYDLDLATSNPIEQDVNMSSSTLANNFESRVGPNMTTSTPSTTTNFESRVGPNITTSPMNGGSSGGGY